MVDHADLNNSTCEAAAEAVERSLRCGESYVDPAPLLRQGLFDAILVLADDHSLKDVLALPLAAIINIDGRAGCVRWTMSYATVLFEHRVNEGVLDVVRAVFEEFLDRPTQLTIDVEPTSGAQRRQLDEWNATGGEFPAETCLEELVENAVNRTSNAEAIRIGEIGLTCSQLNGQCNRVAHWLLGQAACVHPDELIGLFLDKNHLPGSCPISEYLL